MMKTYAEMDSTGTYPVKVYTTNITTLSMPIGVVLAPTGAEGMMLSEGVWVLRPVLVDPVILNNIVRFSEAPAGAVCEIFDTTYNYLAGTVYEEDGIVEFEISSAGNYQITVFMPLPWVPKTVNVVI